MGSRRRVVADNRSASVEESEEERLDREERKASLAALWELPPREVGTVTRR